MITVQPDLQLLVIPGQSATFTVIAKGDNLTYQWLKDRVNISGAISATYTIMMAAESDEGAYHCVVSNAANSVTSTAASLTVCTLYSFHAGFILHTSHIRPSRKSMVLQHQHCIW